MTDANTGCPDGAVITAGRHKIHCLTVIGEIEGHIALPAQNKTTQYEHLMPQLAAIEECPDIHGLLLLLNTVGGDVEAGLALAELVASMEKPTVSLVLGGGHSIGVPLAVSAQKSFIVPTATMILHPVRYNGLVMGLPQTMAWFHRIEDRILEFIGRCSHADPRAVKAAMHAEGDLMNEPGTLLTGRQAVDLGLCDAVGGLSDALRCLHGMIGKGGTADAHETVPGTAGGMAQHPPDPVPL